MRAAHHSSLIIHHLKRLPPGGRWVPEVPGRSPRNSTISTDHIFTLSPSVSKADSSLPEGALYPFVRRKKNKKERSPALLLFNASEYLRPYSVPYIRRRLCPSLRLFRRHPTALPCRYSRYRQGFYSCRAHTCLSPLYRCLSLYL